jgi:hypothetical protein
MKGLVSGGSAFDRTDLNSRLSSVGAFWVGETSCTPPMLVSWISKMAATIKLSDFKRKRWFIFGATLKTGNYSFVQLHALSPILF